MRVLTTASPAAPRPPYYCCCSPLPLSRSPMRITWTHRRLPVLDPRAQVAFDTMKTLAGEWEGP
jgi:hypothetical protein